MKKLFLAFIIIIFAAAISSDSSARERKAPGFALFNLDGKLVTMSAFIKKGNTILSFWASYCVPCKKEIPQVIELLKKYEKTKNLKLVLINIDKEGKEKALPFLEEQQIQNECLTDIYQNTAKSYIPNLKIPALFIVDKTGTIVFEAVGESPENIARLEKAIQSLR